jgi:hypothetical protein
MAMYTSDATAFSHETLRWKGGNQYLFEILIKEKETIDHCMKAVRKHYCLPVRQSYISTPTGTHCLQKEK